MSTPSPNHATSSLPRRVILALAGSPQVLAFLPAVTLAAWWLGGEPYLLVTAVVVPAVFAAGGLFSRSLGGPAAPPYATDTLPGRTSAVAHADSLVGRRGLDPATVAILAVGIDDGREVEERLGPAAFRHLAEQTGARIASIVRDGDLVTRLSASTFGVVLTSPRSGEVDMLLRVADRIRDAVAEPVVLDSTRIYVSASVGIARQSDPPFPSGEAFLVAAERALAEAAAQEPGSVRAWSPATATPARPGHGLSAEIAEALASGQILPWFQPQVSTDTGALTGAEALARWVHPARGLVLPSAFLPAVEDAGLSQRLGAAMLHASLAALKGFDSAGLRLPRVSVNFASSELRNPGIVDRVRWELDRFGLAPDRLTVEVLETVVDATDDDVVTRNLAGLAALGCGIDLDDFGTGHAAIGSIRRFSVQRVKIDRSFIRRVDTDADQQAIVSAMILMADRLGLDTIAEGVETAAEQAALAQLGCRHAQGHAIARPMPEAALRNWVVARGGSGPVVALLPEIAGAGPAAGAAGKTA